MIANSYLLAAVSALATDPLRIKKMFVGLTTKEEDPAEFSLSKEEIEMFKNLGMHAVYLYICGELK
jgi:hypothetical protein